MIAKTEVRKRLAEYENKIREEIKKIISENKKMYEGCSTMEMKSIWEQSKRHAELIERYNVLSEVLMDIIDIRCDEMFDD